MLFHEKMLWNIDTKSYKKTKIKKLLVFVNLEKRNLI